MREFKNKKNSGYQEFIDTFVDEFEETDADLLSSDPCEFPGFRLSVDQALNRGVPPCGVVTGIGRFKSSGGGVRAGLVISNVAFQAGSFDMASAEHIIIKRQNMESKMLLG